MKKFLIIASLTLMSLSAFAQRGTNSCEQDLRRSQLRIDRLQSENDRLRLELATYENQTPVSYGVVCSAACVDFNGNTDMKYHEVATAPSQLEAELNAKQATQKKYSCNYGVKKVKCEDILTNNAQAKLCIAGCVDFNGRIDEKYLGSAKGRTLLEAESAAIKATQSKYSCNYGTKIQACQ